MYGPPNFTPITDSISDATEVILARLETVLFLVADSGHVDRQSVGFYVLCLFVLFFYSPITIVLLYTLTDNIETSGQ